MDPKIHWINSRTGRYDAIAGTPEIAAEIMTVCTLL